MIRLHGLTYLGQNGDTMFDSVSVELPADRRLAILGGKYSGKSTLVQMLCGVMKPTHGYVERYTRISFPGGYLRGFRPAHTGRHNVMFAAKIYGADPDEVFEFVRHVSGLGDKIEIHMRLMTPQDRARLSYVLTYALPFDTYLFDNSIGAIDPEFRARCEAMFEARTRTAGAIVATGNVRIARQHCDCAYVIRNRGLDFYEDVNEAIAVFDADQAAAASVANEEEAAFLAPEGTRV
ncbi:ATP-binding cassette domain-containing protein [Novosphingobium sp.]|uniref:ATP-binding cassette domain-containing protein n=1 Tax=Novosphingobium sp. TaxID=1874826 RepID=UPI003D0DA5FB